MDIFSPRTPTDWFVVIASITLGLSAPMSLGYYVFKPLSEAVNRLNAPRQFLLTDFLWLIAQLQLALGFVVAYVTIEEPGAFMMILGFLTFAVVAMWAGGVSVLSRAGIRHISRRAVFMLVLLPVTLAAMMCSATLVAGAPMGFYWWRRNFWRFNNVVTPDDVFRYSIGVALALAAVLLITFALRFLTQWIVASRGGTVSDEIAATPT